MQNVLTRPQTVVVKPAGLLSTSTVDDFRETLYAAVVSESVNALVVDMAQVESIDSDALMVLVTACKTAKRLGKRFSLCALSRGVQMVFELTQLDQVFEIRSEQVALEAIAV
jgi:anti-sigma B factor antagonist